MLARGKYGIEYTPKPDDDESGGLGWLVLLAVLLMLLSLAWTFVHRLCSSDDADADVGETVQIAAVDAPEPDVPAPADTPPAPVPPVTVPEPPPSSSAPDSPPRAKRTVKASNLLMRLDEARKKGDVEMEASTIEQLRALPGSPVADLDDKLARRLGELNLRRLLGRRRAWVSEVTVKRGDSASRIAAEHGSTLASFARLNGGNVDRLKVGQKAYVLDQPRFKVVIRRRTNTADLLLKDRFFKRYDIISSSGGKDGAYETTIPQRQFWRMVGIEFGSSDRAELEMLLPKSTPVIISEM